ncbi:Crp/Fnr family transcriptional regulator [Hymenobacter sp. YC55]|uniref:Crp/Fnr family transcriptional regulator n=1 Tax=Hymenobacter sp. YC55 TaxID=3034019 RepID=UPI0023F9BB2B|nr:Crp/Fnr family transcriptional regulator [Hymenobacter sp. YC55]MDF7814221.1 Crp/Fnr family transcriptional regulator [Hymenobacter sp. YC55]
MHDAFFNYIQKLSSAPITAEEKERYRQAFTPFKLRKRQYFLQEGNQCKYFAFIVKGAMRQYTVDERGVEHIARLGIENWWMGDRESYIMDTPSIYNIDAWENTEMLIITRPSVLELVNIPVFSEMLRKMDDRNNMANQRRITAVISASAEKRYTEFAACYPELLDRFPQYVIASYLGFTKDTLSRVRSKLLRK